MGDSRDTVSDANRKRTATTRERHGEAYYEALAATGRAAFKDRLAGDPEYRRALGEKIRTGRLAAGSAAPAQEQVCVVPSCQTRFPVPAFQLRHGRKRCPACIAAGRTVCYACGTEMPTRPGLGSRVRCEACAASKRHGAPVAPTVPRDVYTCRGVQKIDRQVTVLGEDGEQVRRTAKATLVAPRYAERCAGAARPLPSDVARWRDHPSPSRTGGTTFDEATKTYQCRACRGLETATAALLARTQARRRRERRVVQTWAEVDELRRDTYRRLATTDERFRQNHEHRRPPGKRGAGAGGQALKAYYAAGARWERTPEWRARVGLTAMVVAWRVGRAPRRHVERCAYCGQVLWYWTSPAAVRPRFHQPCLAAARRSPAWADWHAQAERGPSPWLPVRRGPKPKPGTLTRNLGLAVCHYLGGQEMTELAAELSAAQGRSFTQQAVSKAVAEIMELLPDPAVAGASLRRYVLALGEAKAQRAGAVTARPESTS